MSERPAAPAEVFERLRDAVCLRLADEQAVGLQEAFERACDRAVARERALELLSAVEVSRWLAIPERSVHGLRRSGALPAIRVGKHWRFLRADVARFVLAARSNGK